MRVPESDLELREFIDEAPIGLSWVDAEGRIVWANPAELALAGREESDFIGRNIAEFLVESDEAVRLRSCVSRGESIGSCRAQIRVLDGSIRDVLIEGGGFFRDGRLIHSRLLTRDITHLMAGEESARHSAEATSQLKDEFLSLLSHELRTPLASILVWLGLLKQGGFSAVGESRALDIIERSAKSLERIIEDLLHGSRIAAGGLTLEPQRVDARSIVQAALDEAMVDASQKGLVLSGPLSEAPIWVNGDPGRLQQAVSNILANAIKFTPLGGSVTVVMETIGGEATLRVSDTGEGMSPAFLPFAFDRSRQQDATSTRAHHGLGLGLYVVRHIIEKHGGSVTAESAGAGRGSSFTVKLPVASAPAAEPTDELLPAIVAVLDRTSDTLPEGLKVLVVDDEEDVREALRLMLQQNGMVVTTASSVREGFDLLVRTRPDILLSDIGMPGEDGLSFIRRVRQLPKDQGGSISAAAVSAYASASDRRGALLAGFQHHVAKPVDPVRLLGVIASLARTSHSAGAA